jgi:hypothetical protein
MNTWGMAADWLVAFGTLLLAAVAVFQPTFRGWLYHPKFQVSIKTEPPDCVATALTTPSGELVADAVWLRLWVENVGNATAKNVEVYAQELLRQRADNSWESVGAFPPMNLKWANLGIMHFPYIAPETGKHCDLGHIVDPARRNFANEDAPRLGLTDQQTSMTFDLISAPNHRGHIIAPGEYKLKILVAAEDVRPLKQTVMISLKGTWHAEEARMLRDGVGVTVV